LRECVGVIAQVERQGSERGHGLLGLYQLPNGVVAQFVIADVDREGGEVLALHDVVGDLGVLDVV
jgi:hypothetical protein